MYSQKTWTTFYGNEILFSQLSHQHLSNILWYYEIIINEAPTPYIRAELDKRFGGIILPYSPLHSFTQEIDKLLSMGHITNTHSSDIVINGKWVGRLEYK